MGHLDHLADTNNLDKRISVKIIGYIYRLFFFIFFNRLVRYIRLKYDQYLCNHEYYPILEGSTYMGMETTDYYDPRKLKCENGEYVLIEKQI